MSSVFAPDFDSLFELCKQIGIFPKICSKNTIVRVFQAKQKDGRLDAQTFVQVLTLCMMYVCERELPKEVKEKAKLYMSMEGVAPSSELQRFFS